MRYCHHCKRECDTEVTQRQEAFPVYGVMVDVTADVLTCRVCGNAIFDIDLDNATLERAYRKAGCVETSPGHWKKPEV